MRWIDADAAVQAIAGECSYRSGLREVAFNDGLEKACQVIEAQPTVPERMAEKVHDQDESADICCSECGIGGVDSADRYCWNCGARFKAEAGEELVEWAKGIWAKESEQND